MGNFYFEIDVSSGFGFTEFLLGFKLIWFSYLLLIRLAEINSLGIIGLDKPDF